jgi:hypothetical protein
MRLLTKRQVGKVLEYELAHANRPAVLAALRTRLDEL